MKSWMKTRSTGPRYGGDSERKAHWTDEILSILLRYLEVQEDFCWARVFLGRLLKIIVLHIMSSEKV